MLESLGGSTQGKGSLGKGPNNPAFQMFANVLSKSKGLSKSRYVSENQQSYVSASTAWTFAQFFR